MMADESGIRTYISLVESVTYTEHNAAPPVFPMAQVAHDPKLLQARIELMREWDSHLAYFMRLY